MIELLSILAINGIKSACIIFAMNGSLDKKNKYGDIYTIFGLLILFSGNIIATLFDTEYIFDKYIFIIIFMILYALISREGTLSKKIFVISSYTTMFIALVLLTLIGVSIVTGNRFRWSDYQTPEIIYFYLVTKIMKIAFTIYFIKKMKQYKSLDDTILNWITLGLISVNIISMYLIEDILLLGETVDARTIDIASGLIIIIFTLFAMLTYLYKQVEKNIQLIYINEYEKSEIKHNDEMIKIYEETKGWRHDFSNHLHIIMNLIENKEYNEAILYLSEIDAKSRNVEDIIYTDNVSINAILNIKKSMANDLGIKTSLEIDNLGKIGISKVDLITVISNKLDNAIEACEEVSENKFIEVIIRKNQNYLIIKVKNSTGKNIRLKDGTYISNKAKKYEDLERGLGLIQIDKIINKYGGYINRNYNESYFESVAMLPLNKKAV